MVRRRLWGEEQAIVMGIMLKDDRGQKLIKDNAEVLEKTAKMSELWEVKSEAGTF